MQSKKPVQQKPPVQPKPASKPADPTDADFAELFKDSPWVPAEYKGRLPGPSDEQEKILKALPVVLKAIAARGVTSQDQIRQLAGDFIALAAIPPEEPVLLDFASDLAGALTEASWGDAEMRQLVQQLYVVLNSAALSAQELKALQKEIASLLGNAGGDKNRIQTVLYDIEVINETIKVPF